MRKISIKSQVENSIKKTIENLKKQGIEYIRFKDFTIETEEYIIQCKTPTVVDTSFSYEERVAWNYMRASYEYDNYPVEGRHGNSKFFKIF